MTNNGTWKVRFLKPSVELALFSLVVPIAFVVWSLYFDILIEKEAFGLIVSIFSIVSALLFGAMFSIFAVASSIDRTKLSREFKNIASFKRQLRSINRVVVYLVILSAVCVCVTLLFMLIEANQNLETSILIYMVTHFFTVFFSLVVRIYYFLELAYRKI